MSFDLIVERNRSRESYKGFPKQHGTEEQHEGHHQQVEKMGHHITKNKMMKLAN